MDEPVAPHPGSGGLVRVRLDLGYDGTDFSGWARQPGRRTVQGVLETALQTALRLDGPPAVTVAGRTDAGVHARGQVAHVDIAPASWERERDALLTRLAGLLTRDVRVRSVEAAPPGFDARFSALARRYAYRVDDSVGGPEPLRRREVLHVRHRLDVAAMQAAADLLLGEHDFAAFCRRRPGASTVRELRRLAWRRADTGLVVADVEADAFCHSMVRALVGALLAVGAGRREAGWPAQVLAGRERDPGVTVAAPHGLTLEEVRYPADVELAARAAATRRRRDL
jgi:tRNA pseudouridine38-40 synthase